MRPPTVRAAGDGDDGASQPRIVATSQEEDGFSDVVGRASPPHRDALERLRHVLVLVHVAKFVDLVEDEPWRDGVDANPVWTKLDCQHVGQQIDRGLRAAVGGTASARRVAAADEMLTMLPCALRAI